MVAGNIKEQIEIVTNTSQQANSPPRERRLAIETFISFITCMQLEMPVSRPLVLEQSLTNGTLEGHEIFMTLHRIKPTRISARQQQQEEVEVI
jgi:hypothetical protein